MCMHCPMQQTMVYYVNHTSNIVNTIQRFGIRTILTSTALFVVELSLFEDQTS